MSEQSAKPYLVRALYEWCVEQGYTPFLAVRVNSKTKVPMDYVKNGEIVLNVSPIATHKLTMDNEWTLFNARFNGVTQEIAVPFSAVVGIFAKETGYGMGFQPEAEAGPSDVALAPAQTPALAAITNEATPAPSNNAATNDSAAAAAKPKPTLTVVK
ncbi:MAG: ClpXP protease specificity-enhancing factor [Casimicrobium sp.]